MNSKIRELLNYEKSVLCFDVDGVLAPLEFGEYNHFVTDEEWNKGLRNCNFYQNIRVNNVIKRFLEDKDMARVYVITKVADEIELNQKKEFVFKNYGILSSNVFMVHEDKQKLDRMKEIHNTYEGLDDKYMVMIDDTISVLNNIMDNSSYSTVHVSSFFE